MRIIPIENQEKTGQELLQSRVDYFRQVMEQEGSKEKSGKRILLWLSYGYENDPWYKAKILILMPGKRDAWDCFLFFNNGDIEYGFSPERVEETWKMERIRVEGENYEVMKKVKKCIEAYQRTKKRSSRNRGS